jgi:GNAT superfamily N-acetyltransferase
MHLGFRLRGGFLVIVRPALLADLTPCFEMDLTYTTDYVWQMQAHEHERSIDVRFDTVRLPRPMKVDYPRHPDELLSNWRQEECFLVATDDTDQVIGYLDLTLQAWHSTGWIRNLGVAHPHRRKGVASTLLRAARHWATERELDRMVLEAQTKNYPAIRFADKHGFIYCGYNDRYYPNGDIAIFFSLAV